MLRGPYPHYFLPLYETFIRPRLEYAIQTTHPTLCCDAEAQEKVQRLALKFVKGLRHVTYEAALKQVRLFAVAHRRIRGNLIAMSKISHGLWEFSMASTFAHPTRKGLRGHDATKSDAIRTVPNSPSQFALSHFGTNYQLR